MNLFGQYLIYKIKTKGFTQLKIKKLTGIDTKTLRNIFNGNTTPRIYTLNLLSNLLNENLFEKYVILSNKNYLSMKYLNSSIEEDISNSNVLSIDYLNKEIIKIGKFSNDQKQYYYFLKSLNLYFNGNIDFCLIYLIKSLSINHKNYNISNYKKYDYNNIELRILNLYALIMSYYEKYDICINIMQFICCSCEDNTYYSKSLYNLSIAYFRNKDFSKSLFFIKKSLNISLYNKDSKLIAKSYYQIAIIYYYLSFNKSYIYFKKSLNLCSLMNFIDLKSNILNNIYTR